MDKHIFQDLCALKEGLQEYHGATKLQNIPEIAACALHQTLTAHITISLDQTVSQVLQKINDVLSIESVVLQFGTFQKQMRNNSILPSQRLP